MITAHITSRGLSSTTVTSNKEWENVHVICVDIDINESYKKMNNKIKKYIFPFRLYTLNRLQSIACAVYVT